jgi:hypothetical protein
MDDDKKALEQRKRDALAEDMVKPIVEALDKKNLTAERVACLIDKAARAKKVSHVKLRGGIQGDLPRGYRKITEGIGNVEDETLLRFTEPDHAQQLKAAEQVVRLRGLAPEEKKAGIFGGATIIVQSQIPDPDVIDTDEYQPIEENDA